MHTRGAMPFLWVWLAVACGAEPAPSIPSPASPSAPPPAIAPSIPPAARPSDPCEAHRAAFEHAMASATGTCATDDECGCFPPVIASAGCGGITDAASAARMAAIEADFHRDHCPWPHLCGPWACDPVCREGRCLNGAAGGLTWPTPR